VIELRKEDRQETARQAIRRIGPVDPHVHCRAITKTDPQGQKATIAEVLKQAEKLGVCAICDMPNTIPAVTNEGILLKRLKAAKKAKSKVRYMAWIGVTSDLKQIAEAVFLYNKYPQVVGLKMFAGKSVGDLEIIARKDQEIVYAALARLDYDGPLAVHCEEEQYIDARFYDKEEPWTWANARPEMAEISSVRQQIELVQETGFKGHLHICHVSCHGAVILIDKAREAGLRISCGITPQTLLYSVEKMKAMGKGRSLLLKCNPPIRSESNRLRLMEDLLEGRMDLIETDHAPHTLEDKVGKGEKEPASGVMSLFLLPELYNELVSWGFKQERLEDVFRNKALQIFTKIKI
jgi:dihydroorotase